MIQANAVRSPLSQASAAVRVKGSAQGDGPSETKIQQNFMAPFTHTAAEHPFTGVSPSHS